MGDLLRRSSGVQAVAEPSDGRAGVRSRGLEVIHHVVSRAATSSLGRPLRTSSLLPEQAVLAEAARPLSPAATNGSRPPPPRADADTDAEPSVSLGHDYLLVARGAERTFFEMAGMWPDAPIHTLLYDEEGTGGRLAGRTVRTSSLQRLGVRQRGFRALLPLLPLAAERLEIEPADVLVSSSSAFAHGFRPPAGMPHAVYCHSPFRYVWHARHLTFEECPGLAQPAAHVMLRALQAWDLRAAEEVDVYIANGECTRRRIAEYWGREAEVIHPPVEIGRFTPAEPEDYFVVVGEVIPHKRIDLTLEAARRARCPVKVIGDGPCLRQLQTAYPEAEFLGRIGDAELAGHVRRARAFVMANIEEFGIAAVEAQAAGRPVLAPSDGGTLETVVDGVTGLLLPPGDVDAYAEAMRYTDFDRFDPATIRRNAERFSVHAFRDRMREVVHRVAGVPVTPPHAVVA